MSQLFISFHYYTGVFKFFLGWWVTQAMTDEWSKLSIKMVKRTHLMKLYSVCSNLCWNVWTKRLRWSNVVAIMGRLARFIGSFPCHEQKRDKRYFLSHPIAIWTDPTRLVVWDTWAIRCMLLWNLTLLQLRRSSLFSSRKTNCQFCSSFNSYVSRWMNELKYILYIFHT